MHTEAVVTPEQEQAKRERFLTLLFFVVPLFMLLALIGSVANLYYRASLPGHQEPRFYAQYCRIEIGMTLAEVEAAFSFAGRELTEATEISGGNIKGPLPAGSKAYRWHLGSCSATIQFTGGKVTAKDFFEPYL